eukprot:TRINITY_DN1369_c0_g1_i1.p1 TRINITY_DN1369_c0_g1~~TRINITY_DN1369_c0_g1_i1.p1  ORF type:complete len:325 (+),score=63.56 TRINITY_DN1369_c0_g1_i1:31-975(+)
MQHTKSLTLDTIAHAIKSGGCKRIAFLTGAGVSVSAGIPDFRSPGGMYATLQPDLLTASEDERSDMKVDPTNVVSWRIFRNNQFPYLEVRRPFILGLSERKWLATLSHWFIQVCHDKGLLVRLYTQNIDGLDYQTNIPSDFIVGVHGSLGQIGCEFCGADCDVHEFQEKVKKNIKDIYGCDAQAPKESTPIFCESCGKPGLKPKTVLYGRRLPPAYFESVEKDFPDHVDLLMIAGTSLTVGPANGLVNQVSTLFFLFSFITTLFTVASILFFFVFSLSLVRFVSFPLLLFSSSSLHSSFLPFHTNYLCCRIPPY